MRNKSLHPSALLFLFIPMFLALANCGQPPVATQEEIANRETILAGTPSVTPTVPPSPTRTTLPPTPSATGTITPTPLPPTPTPNPALKGFSFCNQEVGRLDSGRFSAQLTRVASESFPAFERLVLDFTIPEDSAPLSAVANCLTERDFLVTTGRPVAPGSYVLEVRLPGWLHDDAFNASIASVFSQTLTFTNTTAARNAELLSDPRADAGATILVGLEQPVVYRLSLEQDGKRLLIEVARSTTLVVSSDQLTVPLGGSDTRVPDPVFFLLDGDIWRADSTGVISLTQSLETETALSVSSNGKSLAFCRTQEAGIDPDARNAAVPSTLWLMRTDGKEQRRIASVGISCTDPAFSPDGSLLAFSVDETGVAPAQRSIWVIPVEEGVTLPRTASVTTTDSITPTTRNSPGRIASDGQWNRTLPQWLDAETLVYAATAPDGRSTLFMHRLSEDVEHDIGAQLVVGDRYAALARPLVAPDGKLIAVEALRADSSGADLVLLNASGKEQATISEGYWTRPLAWSRQGDLFYLTSACASTFVQEYGLFRRTPRGEESLIMAGTTFGAIGSAIVIESGIVYVTGERAEPGVRGTSSNIASGSSSSLWFWNVGGGRRGIVYRGDRTITELVR